VRGASKIMIAERYSSCTFVVFTFAKKFFCFLFLFFLLLIFAKKLPRPGYSEGTFLGLRVKLPLVSYLSNKDIVTITNKQKKLKGMIWSLLNFVW